MLGRQGQRVHKATRVALLALLVRRATRVVLLVLLGILAPQVQLALEKLEPPVLLGKLARQDRLEVRPDPQDQPGQVGQWEPLEPRVQLEKELQVRLGRLDRPEPQETLAPQDHLDTGLQAQPAQPGKLGRPEPQETLAPQDHLDTGLQEQQEKLD